MSNEEVKKVSPQDIQLVQNLIERCLQLYMNRKEVVNTLLDQAKIEPSFTELVWQKLEEQNQDFFKGYHLRLALKDQILKFNKLLATQAELMRHMPSIAGAASVPVPHVPLLHQNSTCYNSQAMTQENMHQPAVGKLPVGFTNGGASSQAMRYGVGMPGLSRQNDMSPNLQMNQNSNVGIMHGITYAQERSFMYNPANNVLATHSALQELHVPSFIGAEANPTPMNVPIVESDSSLFGFLGQIPRNFSLSDLTTDFSNSSGILESYSRSPYLASDTNFLNYHGNGDIQGGGKRLDTISEGWSYEGFGSD